MIHECVPLIEAKKVDRFFEEDQSRSDGVPDEQATPANQEEPTTFALVDLLLKSPVTVDWLNRERHWQRELFPRFLLIALTSYVAYAVLVVLVLNLASATINPQTFWWPLPSVSWSEGAAWSLPVAYAVGMVLAICVCLPSFYFYSLLAGARLSWLQITSVIGKGMAASAILIMGLAPIYLIFALGTIVLAAPMEVLQAAVWIGLALPFIAGLWGMRAIYLGVLDATRGLPAPWQCDRYCFLRRLVLAWTAVYAAVMPIMIFRLWEMLAGS